MTSRGAGRHRRRLSAQRPQSLLLLEYSGGDEPRGVYLNSGIVPNGSRLFSPGLAGVGTRRGTGTRPGTDTSRGRTPGQQADGGRFAPPWSGTAGRSP